MILKPALAAMLASGLAVPEKPRLILPNPAIVRPGNLEFSRHMLLAMPLTMGAIKPPSIVIPKFVGTATGSNAASATSRSWSHATTPDTTCLIVAGFVNNNSGTSQFTGCTYNGTSLTLIRQTPTNGQGSVALYVMFNPPVGTYTVQVTVNGGDRGISASAANFSAASSVHAQGGGTYSANPMTTTVVGTQPGTPVAVCASTTAGSATMTHAWSSPSGITNLYTNSFLSNSNRKLQTMPWSNTPVAAGSSSLTTTMSGSTRYGMHQVYAILV
jgi:hypothetical protein